MKVTLRFFISIGVFIIGIIILNKCSAKEVFERDKVLNNDVEFKGYVIDFKTSNNHAFGVIRLQLTESSVSTFNNTLKNGIYPYRINGNIAELYTTIPDTLDYYDALTIRSNSNEIEFEANKKHEKYTTELYVIEDSENIKFVKKYTQFE